MCKMVSQVNRYSAGATKHNKYTDYFMVMWTTQIHSTETDVGTTIGGGTSGEFHDQFSYPRRQLELNIWPFANAAR